MTNRLTRARSICGSCSEKSGTLSGDSGKGEPAGMAGLVPGCECNALRPQNMPSAAMPLLIRNRLRVMGVFIVFCTNGNLAFDDSGNPQCESWERPRQKVDQERGLGPVVIKLHADNNQTRSARTGSTRLARRAGRKQAINATAIKTTNADPNAMGSRGL